MESSAHTVQLRTWTWSRGRELCIRRRWFVLRLFLFTLLERIRACLPWRAAVHAVLTVLCSYIYTVCLS